MDTDTENTIKHKELKEKQAHRWLSDVVVQLSGSERCAHAPSDTLTTKINRNVFKSTTFLNSNSKPNSSSNQRTGNRRSVLDCLIVSELLLYVCLVFFSLYFLFV